MIHFTQYLKPNGRQTAIHITRPKEIEDMAEAIVESGLRFEAEVLMTDEISLTISDGQDDLDIEIISNGPEVPVAVDRLVKRGYQIMKHRRKLGAGLV